MTTVFEQAVQPFDFAGFKRAFVEQDLKAWLAYRRHRKTPSFR